MKTVYCPVMDRQVEGVECMEIVMVADREINKRILPPEINWNEDVRQTCLNCKWHAYLPIED